MNQCGSTKYVRYFCFHWFELVNEDVSYGTSSLFYIVILILPKSNNDMKTVLHQITEKTRQNERAESEVIKAEIANCVATKGCITLSV
jgi:hypothetical protein